MGTAARPAWRIAIAIDRSAGKIASPVVKAATTGLGAETDVDLTLPDQEQITKLQNEVDNLNQQLQKADGLNQELLEVKSQHWLATEELRIANERCKHLEAENQRLQKKSGNQELPDYEVVRDRVLNKLKVGKQSTAGKAIGEFIRELQKLPVGNVPTKGEQLPKVTQLQPVTWENRADDFLREVAGNG